MATSLVTNPLKKDAGVSGILLTSVGGVLVCLVLLAGLWPEFSRALEFITFSIVDLIAS